MEIKKDPAATDAHAISFLGIARQYQKAANLLYDSDKTLITPTYFMYMHAIELALKAFLRAFDLPIVGQQHTCLIHQNGVGLEPGVRRESALQLPSAPGEGCLFWCIQGFVTDGDL